MKTLKGKPADYALILLGAVVYGLAFNLFLEPNNISPGGLSGIAMIIRSLTNIFSIGTIIVVLNIPLFLAGWRKLGKAFVIKSLLGMLASSVMIDLLNHLPPVKTDSLLAAIYGGLLMGAGLGLVLLSGATTGGVDIAARLLKLKFRNVSMGRLILLIDFLVAVLSGIAFSDINRALYSIIALYVSSIVMDGVIYGFEFSKVAYIISDDYNKMADAISQKLQRGATFLNGTGAYTGKDKKVVLCVIKRQQVAELKDLVREVDPTAFLIITEAHQVIGDGFDSHYKEEL